MAAIRAYIKQIRHTVTDVLPEVLETRLNADFSSFDINGLMLF